MIEFLLIFLVISVAWFVIGARTLSSETLEECDLYWDDSGLGVDYDKVIPFLLALGPVGVILWGSWVIAWDIKNYQVERGIRTK
jgi:hypothetical protein